MGSKCMKHALKLAEKGLGFTYPKPTVGTVIMINGRISDEAHAEGNAICPATELVEGAAIYVTLKARYKKQHEVPYMYERVR